VHSKICNRDCLVSHNPVVCMFVFKCICVCMYVCLCMYVWKEEENMRVVYIDLTLFFVLYV
jgi:hypothetical protein